MRVIAYIRVSRDEQNIGLEVQQLSCEQYCKNQGLELVAIFSDDGISGGLSFDKRPGIVSAINELQNGDILLVAKRDRISRGDVLAMAMIESCVARKGARIISVVGEGTENDDPSSILMRRMVDAFAEYERLIIGARTKAALQTKKKKGQRVGHIPFGQQLSADGIHLEKCEIEQNVLREINEFNRRRWSMRDMAKRLNAQEMLNRGSNWNASSIHRILRRVA